MIKIGYAGILQHHEEPKKGWQNRFKNWIWTYQPQAVNPSYRSPVFLFRALSALRDKKVIDSADIQLHLWGNIAPYFEACAQSMGLNDMVSISGYRSHQETIQALKEMDILFLPLEKSNSKQHRNLFVPSKLFEYIAIGKPILAICEPSEAQEILLESGLGIIISPDNENELINTIYQLIQDPSILKNYKRNDNILNQYSAETATQKLVDIFNRL
jgi:glycosyltransferase involved in cell wall biosynthesis